MAWRLQYLLQMEEFDAGATKKNVLHLLKEYENHNYYCSWKKEEDYKIVVID